MDWRRIGAYINYMILKFPWIKQMCSFIMMVVYWMLRFPLPDPKNRKKCFPIRGYNIENGTLRMVRELGPAHFLFPIKSFSAIDKQNGESHESEIFEAGGFKWRLSIFPNGNKNVNVKDHISLYLRIEETNLLDSNWEVHATLKFFLYDHINKNYMTVEDLDGTLRRFDELKQDWGLDRLIPLNDFTHISNGFLMEDSSCTFGIEVFVVKPRERKQKLPPLVQGSIQVYTWIINNFSNIDKFRNSENFLMGGTNWFVRVLPPGSPYSDNPKSMAMALHVESPLPSYKWDVAYKLRVVDQINDNHHDMSGNDIFTTNSTKDSTGSCYNLPLEKFDDPSLGFIKNDTLIVQVIFDYIHGAKML